MKLHTQKLTRVEELILGQVSQTQKGNCHMIPAREVTFMRQIYNSGDQAKRGGEEKVVSYYLIAIEFWLGVIKKFWQGMVAMVG